MQFDTDSQMIDTLCSVFHLPQTGVIPFRVVVVNSTGHKVYPKNIKEYPDDKKLLDSMTAIMKSYVDKILSDIQVQ